MNGKNTDTSWVVYGPDLPKFVAPDLVEWLRTTLKVGGSEKLVLGSVGSAFSFLAVVERRDDAHPDHTSLVHRVKDTALVYLVNAAGREEYHLRNWESIVRELAEELHSLTIRRPGLKPRMLSRLETELDWADILESQLDQYTGGNYIELINDLGFDVNEVLSNFLYTIQTPRPSANPHTDKSHLSDIPTENIMMVLEYHFRFNIFTELGEYAVLGDLSPAVVFELADLVGLKYDPESLELVREEFPEEDWSFTKKE